MKKILKQIVPESTWGKLSKVRRKFLPFRIDGRGERVHIDGRSNIPFEKMDMYQKSHIRRYEFAQKFVKQSDACGDFACGTGYGTVMLANKARTALGADINCNVVKEIQKRYAKIKNVSFVCKNLLKLRYKNTFDVLVSFETIEHLNEEDIPALFGKFNDALKQNGVFIFSTPYLEGHTKEAIEKGFHLTFNIEEEKINKWLLDSGFTKGIFSYQNYQTHEISPTIEPKDFIIGVAQKRR